MNAIDELLEDNGKRIFISRSGMATRCRIACSALEHGKSSVVIANDRKEWATATALASLFISDLSHDEPSPGLPSWEKPVLSMPPVASANEDAAWMQRIAALYGLAIGRVRCVIATFDSIILRYMPADFFCDKSLGLGCGTDLSPELIIEQAVEWGFRRTQFVTSPGELARRGDIIDIFPPGYSKPVRMEFFGDTIDGLRIFDADSQRSIAELENITILPACPFSFAPSETCRAKTHFERLYSDGHISENECYTFKKSLDEGSRRLLPGVVFERPSNFEDWLPQTAVWLLPGEADSSDAIMEQRHTCKEKFGDESNEIPQPATLTLRGHSSPAPWNSFQCIFENPLVMGIEDRGATFQERPLHSFSDLFPMPEAKDRPWQYLSAALKEWKGKRRQVILSFSSSRARNKFLKLAEPDGITPLLRYSPVQKGIFALISPFRDGMELAWDNSLVIGENIIYPRAEKTIRQPSRVFRGLDSFDNIEIGDLLVHRDYGIGRYAGLQHVRTNAVANDFLLLEYSGMDKLYVPADRLGLIQRFKGTEGQAPVLDKLGSSTWSSGREKARKAIEKIAADLVEVYAFRKVAKGFRYDPPGELYREFEATFGFEETPDQARAIQEVLEDMENAAPMDRLVCGDVGFGKTEVALRAAFRAASEGRQVALLCPTTVLAEQHYQTFRSRLSGFPVNVGLLSRFVSRTKQKEVLASCASGQIDILIGTHRLLSNDVQMPNLALLILDEEQRFGVRHKEKLKALKKNVDVLTLTATPIPRTLQLSMSGIRDLSIIETAPVERKPVASAVIRRDGTVLGTVIRRELERKGQVFWVYNRVQGLDRVAEYVQKLVPEAKVGMAHGQMGETALENAMRQFWHGELDVLVCTSIVESGLDFPRANTLVVDQAQMFGLGQLYQLRGRVGRSDRQAYAFFVVPDDERLTPLAEERLRVIMDMDYLGAGFQVAMEDLRLRGAGNILGEVQTGHMSRVGLDLYLEMLEEAVSRLKGTPVVAEYETELTLGVAAHIPENYIEDGQERLRSYKALTSAADGAAREAAALSLRDRFGPYPEELRNFLAVLDFKQFLGKIQIERADIQHEHVRLYWRQGQTAVSPEAIVELVSKFPESRMLPPSGIELPLVTNLPFERALGRMRTLLSGLSDSDDKCMEHV